MDESIQQIDYNMLLMMHLNRLSFITTSNFIESINKDMAEKFIDPPMLGATAMNWGVQYLYCMIPDDLIDKKFEQDEKNCLKLQKGPAREFIRLRALVNLMNRRGLLMSKENSGYKTIKPDEDIKQ